MSRDIEQDMVFFLENRTTPVILYYGDTIWKKRWVGYELIDLPGGRKYHEDAVFELPTIKAKRGQKVTQDRQGFSFHGVGTVAANLTEIDGPGKYESLQLIFNADPQASAIAFITENDDIVYWIDRDDIDL